MPLLTKNKKMKLTSKRTNQRIYDFSISRQSCVKAGECKRFCYAKQGHYRYCTVKKSLEEKYEATQKPNFVVRMAGEILYRGVTHVRIHSCGDFYSREYLNKWIKIARLCPNVTLYAYTKNVSLFKSGSNTGKKVNRVGGINFTRIRLPSNLKVVFSYGGKEDHLITKYDKRVKVFSTLKALMREGYVCANYNDLVCLGPKKKIGLIYHGGKKMQTQSIA